MKQTILLIVCWHLAIITCWAQQRHDIRIQHFSEADGFSEAVVSHIIQDYQGYIWLATWDGLRRYDGYRFQTFKARPGDHCPLETNRINYIEEAADHNIICWSNDKFYSFNPKTMQFSPYKKAIKTSIYHPSEETKNRIQSLKEYNNIEYSILYEDNQKGIWVNSYRGLERISEIPTFQRTDKANEQEEVISATYMDSNKKLWVADKNGFIRIFNDKKQWQYLAGNGQLTGSRTAFGYAAYTIFEDSRHQIWIGCKPGGLFRLTPQSSGYKITRFQRDSLNTYSINCDAVYDIQEDAQKRLLIATYGGGLNIATRQDNGQVKFIHCDNLLKNFPKEGLRSRCLRMTKNGILLLGTNDGLYTASFEEPYEKMHFFVNNRRPHDASSISNNFVMEILPTKEGHMFVCTSGGGTDQIMSQQLLSDTIRFRHYSVREGISSDMNLTLTEDANGNVWIVSSGSLSMLTPQTGIATNYWRLLTEKGEVFTEATPSLLPNGTLILGTTLGFLPINPKEIAKSTFVPHIVFDCENSIKLSPDEKDVSIRFAALDYNKNEDIIYAYRMEGVDREWRYTKSNELNYAQLAPGDYTLHIKSTNGDGVWVDNEAVITIHRSAHFNETPWAWMLYGLLITLGFMAIAGTLKYIRTLKRELKDVRLTSKEQIELLGARIKEMLPINEEVKEIQEGNDQLSQEDQLFATRLKAFVEENISNSELSVMDIAQAMNVSRTILFVRTKQIFNSSPNNYVLNTRINYAKRLLQQPDIRVSEVAFKSGFSDPKYFSRCFKKLTGKLPKEICSCPFQESGTYTQS